MTLIKGVVLLKMIKAISYLSYQRKGWLVSLMKLYRSLHPSGKHLSDTAVKKKVIEHKAQFSGVAVSPIIEGVLASSRHKNKWMKCERVERGFEGAYHLLFALTHHFAPPSFSLLRQTLITGTVPSPRFYATCQTSVPRLPICDGLIVMISTRFSIETYYIAIIIQVECTSPASGQGIISIPLKLLVFFFHMPPLL